MALCIYCQQVNLESLWHPDGLEHLPNIDALRASANTCSLCRVMLMAINETQNRYGTEDPARNDGWSNLSDLNSEPGYETVKLYSQPGRRFGYNQSEDRPYGIQGFTVHMRGFGGMDIPYLRLFAKSESTARRNQALVTGPALPNSGSEEAFSLMRTWLHECTTQHSKCLITVAGERLDPTRMPQLPNRILEIDDNKVWLRMTNGISGQYAALSHCWGRQQQLTTTTQTLQTRLDGIPFEVLPKTFQDAVTVVRNLGMHYLWIDSLCIIQDDPLDWNAEAAKMGLVYSNAHLTIAATGASNGSKGCFIDRGHHPHPVRLRAYPGDDSDAAAMYATLHPGDIDDVYESPLGKRAWITQEWLLSRRAIHFTKSHLVWSCQETMQSETGEKVVDELHIGALQKGLAHIIHKKDLLDSENEFWFEFFMGWRQLIAQYSERQLTYENDKLIALDGLIDQIRVRTGLPCYHGLWAGRLEEQLLWHGKDILRRPQNLSFVPSWSWASTMGPIQFDLWDPPQPLSRTATVEGCKLTIKVPVRAVSDFGEPTRPNLLRFPLISISKERIGFAWLDEGIPPTSKAYCLAIARHTSGINIILAQSVHGQGMTFKRIGCGRVERFEWIEDAVAHEVYLV